MSTIAYTPIPVKTATADKINEEIFNCKKNILIFSAISAIALVGISLNFCFAGTPLISSVLWQTYGIFFACNIIPFGYLIHQLRKFQTIKHKSFTAQKTPSPIPVKPKATAPLARPRPSARSKKKALIIVPTYDPREITGKNSNLCDLIPRLNKDYDHKTWQVSTIDQFKNALKTADKIDLLLINTHGLNDCFLLGKNALINPKQKYRISDIKKEDFSHLSKTATIVLNSCFTGRQGGLAQAISKAVPQANVFAPDNTCLGITQIRDLGKNFPTFIFRNRDSNGKETDYSILYKNGCLNSTLHSQ